MNNDAKRIGGDVHVERKAMPSVWSWQLNAPIVLEIPATPFVWRPTEGQALPDGAVAESQSQMIRLVPYGCTKFRISMFPVTSKAWTEER